MGDNRLGIFSLWFKFLVFNKLTREFNIVTRYRSDGVTLIGFDSFLQITLVVKTLSF